MSLGILFDTIQEFEQRNDELSILFKQENPDDLLFEKYAEPILDKNEKFWMQIILDAIHTQEELDNAVPYEFPDTEEDEEYTLIITDDNDYEIIEGNDEE